MPPKKIIKTEVQPQEEASLSVGYQALRAVNKFVLYGGLGLFFFTLFLVDVATFAIDPNLLMGELTNAGTTAHLGQENIGIIIANIIQTVLGMLGVVFVILIIYSGFLWMTASGEREKIQTAQAHLRNAIIGVVIVIGAQIITYWVLFQVTTAALRGQPEAPAASVTQQTQAQTQSAPPPAPTPAPAAVVPPPPAPVICKGVDNKYTPTDGNTAAGVCSTACKSLNHTPPYTDGYAEGNTPNNYCCCML